MPSTLEKLFTRHAIAPVVKKNFEVGASWRFGGVFGTMLVATAWGGDARESANGGLGIPGSDYRLPSLRLLRFARSRGDGNAV